MDLETVLLIILGTAGHPYGGSQAEIPESKLE